MPNIYEENENTLIEIGLENVDYYSLINNYGFHFQHNNVKYDLRHWLNVYGASVDYWGLYGRDLKTNEYTSQQSFDTFDEAVEYLKKLKLGD